MAMMSPWGLVDCIQAGDIRGVSFVGTASHGGLRISKALAEKELPTKALAEAIFYNNYYFFEEDCAWAIPCFFSQMIANSIQGLFTKPVSSIADDIMGMYFLELKDMMN